MSQNDESIVLTLLAQAREGDDAARDELFSKCRNYVALIARTQVESWMQTKVDASDLVQQTLLEAHLGFADFRGNTEGEWLAWLRKILHHNTHDFIRRYKGTDKRRVQREVRLRGTVNDQSRSFFHDPPGHEQTPSQIIAEHEQQIELADAIAQLSDDHREVIILRNLQRLPFDEIATRMDRTRPAVQMLWMRAIQKLQQSLTNRDDESPC
ncbi:MAG: sigma-70 family RNA polymerase sigma factor [Planctomycetaceae bacterium]|nr:sigma-70 family RNA polymerase sigma factor [Planctomycetaceae bacterium]